MTSPHDHEFTVNRHISVTPETRSNDEYEPGDSWEIRFDDEEKGSVRIELPPAKLHELYTEVKDIHPDDRQAGHTAACDFCGEQVPFDKAVPNDRDEPVHRECYVDAYGTPKWLLN
jgi:formylmethanofuran dehydrogenase subunit E